MGWPQQPPTEKVLQINMGFHDSVKNIFFKTLSDISPQIIDFKNLDDSVVIFQALQISAASLTSACNLTGLNSLYSHISSKNFLVLMDHQKSNFLLIYGTSFYQRLLRPAYVIFFENWLMKLKCPNLRNKQIPSL